MNEHINKSWIQLESGHWIHVEVADGKVYIDGKELKDYGWISDRLQV